jgi:protein-tyrosine phosphatase
MTAEQRAAVVRQVPALVRRTFTLLEFADLARLADIGPLPGETAERLAALVQAAPRARARRPVGAADDIADPYGREESAYAEALAAVDEAVAAVLAAISGGVVTPREHRQGLAVTPPAAFG